MREDISAALAPGQVEVQFAGRKLTACELDCVTDMPATEGRKVVDFALDLIVLCVVDAEGKPEFTADDLPRLRKAGRKAIKPLIDAVFRANGLDIQAEAKNSAGDPASA